MFRISSYKGKDKDLTIERLNGSLLQNPGSISCVDEMNRAGARGDIRVLQWFKDNLTEDFNKHTSYAIEQAYYCCTGRKRKKTMQWLYENGTCDDNYLESYVGLDNIKRILNEEPGISLLWKD